MENKKSEVELTSNQGLLAKDAKKTEAEQAPHNSSSKSTECLKEKSNLVKLKAFIGHLGEAPHFCRNNEFILRGYRIGFNSVPRIVKR